MRNLAFRFVRNVASKNSETFMHVVDPNFDLRHHLKDPDLFQKELKERKFKAAIDVASLNQKYQNWWKIYSYFLEAEEKTQEYRDFKNLLSEQDTVLIDALKLPNRLELNPHFLEASPSKKWKIDEFNFYPSLMKTSDEIEKRIFDGTNVLRYDPPRFARPAVTEAFNLSPNEIVRFHEGQNPPMHLVGISPPGLLVPFVSMKFGSTNSFPLLFIAKGAGYSRNFRGWQQQFISILILKQKISSLHASLNAIRLSLDNSISKLFPKNASTKRLLPHELESYESSAANTIVSSIPIIRYSSAGTYLAQRLKIITDTNEKESPEFLNIGFVQINVSALHSVLKNTKK
uniref:Uncharacterized protein n=1 Tax=Panagrolaimus davidi TaxID=227884 RepID=A0A914PNN0_9BILA